MKYIFILILILNGFISNIISQDTTWIRGFNFGSTTRDSILHFPEGDHNRFSKVLMYYSMRCRDGLVSTSSERNKGCGEWDYSCNTNIIDSTRTDSLKVQHPNYIVSGVSDNFFSYTTKPTYTYYSFTQKNITASGTAGISVLPVQGAKGDATLRPADAPVFKGYFMYPASSLPQGLSGNVSGLRFFHSGTGTLPFFQVRIAYTSSAVVEPDGVDDLAFTEVVNRSVTFSGASYTDVYFHKPISYPGSTGVVVEVSYQGDASSVGDVRLTGTSGTLPLSVVSGPDGFLVLGDNGPASVPVAGLSTLSNAVTIGFWSRGSGGILPANNSVLHAVDSKGQRQLNVHLPWSNARVYWDCGSDGSGYDRIDKAAVPAEFEDIWHYWTFTKNVTTGSMKIYLDGVLWHSATGKKKPISIDKMLLGTDQDGNIPYPGDIDDFSVWNRELTPDEILQAMARATSQDDDLRQGLVLSYDMNEGSGNVLRDGSPFAQDASFAAPPVRRLFRGRDINKSWSALGFRPDISFLKGNATVTVTETEVRDSVQNKSIKVIPYRIADKKLKQDPPFYVWASGFFPVFGEDGTVIDEVEVPEENVLFIEPLTYYNYYPAKYELLSFVTPYGIGLDFGLQGKTWVFDVTDYGPVLKGRKRFLMDKGGEWQEEMDIRFAFIEGTPSRNVLDIRQVWPATSYGYTSILQNQHLEPREMRIDPGQVKSAKVRTVATGHGQEGEFISRLHSLNVNGGTTEYTWPLWKECADNPVYPQGGTWVYDRAGWCPGAPSDLREFEIMPLIPSNGIFTLDYGLNTASGDSRYIVNTQLVTYGPLNHILDAAITDVLTPSNQALYKRRNPFCGKPVIRLQNLGSTPVTSALIEYSCGTTTYTHTWSGTLAFSQSQDVTLPELPAEALFAGNTFQVRLLRVNGVTDENPDNDNFHSDYEHPALLTGDLIVGLKTNGMPGETSWKVKNTDGTTIASSKSGLNGFTLYQDTIPLAQGCYQLQFSDSDDDGISWWANGDGDGFIRAKGTQSNWNFFNPDFGREFTFHFYNGTVSATDEIAEEMALTVYPNPVTDEVIISCKGVAGQVSIEVYTATGALWSQRQNIRTDNGTVQEAVSMDGAAPGLYIIRARSEKGEKVEKVIKL